MNTVVDTQVPVTILLFARNRPHYLPFTLQSIEDQTLRRWRLVLSDNSSDEASSQANAGLIAAFQQRNPENEVLYVRRSGTLSVMEHFRIALRETETPFAAVFNDDDIYLPHHLEQAVEWLSAGEDHGMTTGEALVINSTGRLNGAYLNTLNPPADGDFAGWLSIWLDNHKSHFGNWPGFVLRTQVVQDLPPIDNCLTDVMAVIWNVMHGYRVKGFQNPSYLYRIHDVSVTKMGIPLAVERHRLLVWLARHQFLPLTKKYAFFPLFALKAVLALKLRYGQSVRACLRPPQNTPAVRGA